MAEAKQKSSPTTKAKKTEKSSIITDVKSEDSGFSSKTCSAIEHHEDLPPASKPRIVRIDSKPTAFEERSHSLKLPSIPGEKYEWKLFYFPQPMKSAIKPPHHSLMTSPKLLSSIKSKKALSEPPAESHKFPPIEKLSTLRLPSKPMRKSSTWPVVAGVRLPPIPSLPPKYPPSTMLLMQKSSVTSALEKLQQKWKQKYKPTLPIFKPDLKTREEAQTQEPMDIRKLKHVGLEEVRNYVLYTLRHTRMAKLIY